jgi:hypothetical protein
MEAEDHASRDRWDNPVRRPKIRGKVGRVRWILVFSAVATAACVPTARYRPPSAATLNAPAPPLPRKTAKDLLTGQPTVQVVSPPPSPGPDEQTVEGSWRWAGSEYRYIPARNEKKQTPYTWDRP